MGRRKQGDDVENALVAPVSVSLMPVKIEQPEAEAIDVSGLPDEWQAAEKLGGFAPSPLFETPGEALFGTYVGMRDNVGPNNSRVYEIMAYQGPDKKAELTAVWGSTALDRMFDSAFPKIKSGDRIGIIYLGSKATKRNQNPVKLFQLRVLRPGEKGATTMGNGDGVKAAKPAEVVNPK